VNYRGQKGNLFDVGAEVSITPANNQNSLPGTVAVAATTGPGTLASSFANTDVIDGVTLATGNVILIKDQADPTENGVYTVAASGAPARTTGWTNGVGLQAFQKTVEISGGAVNKGKFFVQTNNVLSPFISIGSTPLIFAQDPNQMVNQKAILAATAQALTRHNVKPLFSQPFAREDGGVITWDNDILENFYSKQPVNVATTAALAANTYSAGVLTASGNGALAAIDGYAPQVGDRILVKNEAESQTFTLSGVPASGAFVANYNGNPSASILWGDNAAAIQTKLRAVPGLSQATVAGSLASETLTIALIGVQNPSLFTITSNTLQTVAPAAITITVAAVAATGPVNNGIYVVTSLGGVSSEWALTRALDCSEGSAGADPDFQVRFGMCAFVLGGTVNGKSTFFQSTASPIVFGTTAQVFLNLTTVMTTNQVNQPVDGNQNIDSQEYAQA
jgi:hypothetical protein